MLEFDYSQEVAVDTWDGISVYHDFELHENGDITAWRSYQVGKGKRFEKSELDGKYKSGTSQPSTGATFVADVGKLNGTFQPKLDLSGRRKQNKSAKSGENGEEKEGPHRGLESGPRCSGPNGDYKIAFRV